MTTSFRNPSRYGWRPQLPDHRDHKLFHSAEAIKTYPPSFDLTDRMPAVYNQGQLGSCVGNAVAGAIGYNLLKQGIGHWTPSRLFIYYNARRLEGTTASDDGAMIRDGIRGVAKWGTPHNASWPYDIDKFADEPPGSVYDKAEKNLVTEYLAVKQTVNDICATIAGGEPVVIGFSVYDAFESDQVAKSGVLDMPNSSEQLLGGHAVLLVGYDTDAGRVKVRNSWGSRWGQHGYFTMPFAYVTDRDLSSDFWVIRSVDMGEVRTGSQQEITNIARKVVEVANILDPKKEAADDMAFVYFSGAIAGAREAGKPELASDISAFCNTYVILGGVDYLRSFIAR